MGAFVLRIQSKQKQNRIFRTIQKITKHKTLQHDKTDYRPNRINLRRIIFHIFIHTNRTSLNGVLFVFHIIRRDIR